jgi:Tol biopolymer transport system component
VQEEGLMRRAGLISIMLVLAALLPACAGLSTVSPDMTTPAPTVPHEARRGIYALDLASREVRLVYGTNSTIRNLDLDPAGETFAFSQWYGGTGEEAAEIATVPVTGGTVTRLTDNAAMDVYPVWSPDGRRLLFLTMRGGTLDLYLMDRDGGDQRLLYDSGGHDADIDWIGDTIAFTRDSRIWLMNDDGTGARAVTDPPRAGEWGNANLPFGDYDPRLSPDGSRLVFERLVDDTSPHGNYDFFLINADGTGEIRLTDTGDSQGLASWSHAGDRLVFTVAAHGEQGAYDLYMINSDGTGYESITPDYFPPGFLCHTAIFSPDDTIIYFVGQWWE